MYQKRTIKDVMYYSIEIKKRDQQMKNIKLLKRIGYKLLSGYGNLSFIELTLKEIKIAKQLFLFQVELGEEAVIPHQLNQRSLGQSYQFYNPVLSIIEKQCSDQKRQLFNKGQEQLARLAQDDKDFWKKAFRRFFSIDEDHERVAEQESNLYQRYNRIDKNEIDY